MITETTRLNHLAVGAVLLGALMGATPAFAEDAPAAQDAASAAPAAQAVAVQPPAPANTGGTDIFSRNTFSVLVDLRLAVGNGATSFVNGGFGKTRFQGSANGDYRATIAPMEADVIWNPRFTNSLSANISAVWQRDHDGNGVDLMEAFLTYLPPPSGRVRFSGRAGLMWPEISLEHATGGAWSVVNTITPSAINSWVGEEVKVVGAEGTLRTSIGEHDLGFTGGIFGGNDTSGTLLSFRGWALQDIKATALGSFRLPPLNNFITLVQQNKTDNTIEIDKRPGFYARVDWRPPYPFTAALFYYDNEGDPEAMTESLQWGWRTRFWNLGINAKVAPGTRLLIQGMTGSTIMGFPDNGQRWVHTDFLVGLCACGPRLRKVRPDRPDRGLPDPRARQRDGAEQFRGRLGRDGGGARPDQRPPDRLRRSPARRQQAWDARDPRRSALAFRPPDRVPACPSGEALRRPVSDNPILEPVR